MPAAAEGPSVRTRRRRIAAALVAVGLIVAGASYLSNRPSPAEGPPPAGMPVPLPVQAVLLARGSIPLDFPFMVMYGPAVNTANACVSTHVEFSSDRDGASNVSYEWTSISGPRLPIVFRHLVPREELADPPNAFRIFPAGTCSAPCLRLASSWSWPYPGGAYLLAKAVDLNYSVFLVRPGPPFERAEWLEVRFSLEGTSRWSIDGRLPRENITEAAGEDRVPVGSQLQVFARQHESIRVDELDLPLTEFHNDLRTLAFDAGVLGAITASLVSTFRWTRWTRYWIEIDLMDADLQYPENVTLRLFLALLAEQVP